MCKILYLFRCLSIFLLLYIINFAPICLLIVDIYRLFQRRLEEGASQIPPDSSERAALREELFTEVLKPDRNGWLHTYGLGPCRSQVFGTRYTRSQDQRIKDQLRAEVRQEVLAEVGGEIDLLKREYARMAAHMAGIGHPLPPSPNGNGDGDRDVGGDHTQSMSEHN